MIVLQFIAGLALLVAGGELLVRGASRLAEHWGISPLVVGLTVVAFGTSAPEMVVSSHAALTGQPGVALGNVIGSNIFNILFILGLSALITPLVVAQQLIRFDVPLMIALSVTVLLLALDGGISRLEGGLLLLGVLLYTGWLIRQSRRETSAVRVEYEQQFGAAPAPSPHHGWRNAGAIVGGLILLILGSRWLVDSAVTLAQALGVSPLVIGLTIVAAGTSMPEVVTSVVASLRGARDIAVGNVVGSNLFNILAVLGLSSLLAPAGIAVPDKVLHLDLPVMIAAAIVCLPIFFTGGRISRWEGALLLGYYAAYTLYLILAAAQHPALPLLTDALLYFVIPLSVLTLGVVVVQAWRKE